MRLFYALLWLLALPACTLFHHLPEAAAPEPLPTVSTAVLRDSLAPLPPYLVPVPAGSTPRQRRQWQAAQRQNLARAGVAPARIKIKGSTVATTGATITNAPKARGPVATGASQAQDNTKAGQHGGALATAPGASAGATTRTGLSPWALVVGGLCLLALLLLGLTYRFRKIVG